MEKEDLAVLAGFEAVWQRVQQAGGGDKAAARDPRESLLQRLYEQWRGLEALSCRCCGGMKGALCREAAVARYWFGRLQTACFLDGGDIWTPCKTCNFASCTPYNLRKLYQNAEKLAEDLQNARRGEGDIMAGAASAMERQTRQLELLIGRMLT